MNRIDLTNHLMCSGAVLVLESAGTNLVGQALFRFKHVACGHTETRTGNSLRRSHKRGTPPLCRTCGWEPKRKRNRP